MTWWHWLTLPLEALKPRFYTGHGSHAGMLRDPLKAVREHPRMAAGIATAGLTPLAVVLAGPSTIAGLAVYGAGQAIDAALEFAIRRSEESERLALRSLAARTQAPGPTTRRPAPAPSPRPAPRPAVTHGYRVPQDAYTIWMFGGNVPVPALY